MTNVQRKGSHDEPTLHKWKQNECEEVSAGIMFREFSQGKEAATLLDEVVRARVPEGIAEPDCGEYPADFVGTWASRCG